MYGSQSVCACPMKKKLVNSRVNKTLIMSVFGFSVQGTNYLNESKCGKYHYLSVKIVSSFN
jgi:hypothetical protein